MSPLVTMNDNFWLSPHIFPGYYYGEPKVPAGTMELHSGLLSEIPYTLYLFLHKFS